MRRIILISSAVVIALAILVAIYFLFFKPRHKNHLVLYGNVDVRQVDIGFRVSGKVADLCFQEGDLVKPGDLLAVLDKTPYDSQLAQAEGNVEAIKANLANAEILLKRRQELIGITGVSQEDLDNALSTVNQLRGNLLTAESALAVAKDNLRYTEAFAPNEGIILSRVREPGSVVRETDVVYTVSLTNPIWIRAFVDEPNLGDIYYGQEAQVWTDSSKDKYYCGKIGFISPVAEFTPKTVETQQLRTDLVYRLRIYVDHPDANLKQGMPVTVKLPMPQTHD